MKFCKNLLIVFATTFFVLVNAQNEVNAEMKVFLSTDDLKVEVINGKILCSSNIYNLKSEGVYITQVRIDLTINANGRTYSYPNRYFYFDGMYIGAGQRIWNTFVIYDDSIPNITSGDYNATTQVWYR